MELKKKRRLITAKKQIIKQTYLYEEAGRRLDELRLLQKSKELSLEKAPDGKISIKYCNGRAPFYYRENPGERCGEYIHKSAIGRIKKLVQKAYDEKVLKLISKEITNLEKFLKKSDGQIAQIRECYSNYPDEVKELVEPIDMSDEDYAKMWQSVIYTPKPISEEMSYQKTERGEIVRSKSELNIANALYRAGIPYRYECPLRLQSGKVIHPDFMVLNVRKRKVFYWEHRGMMDDREYVRHSVLRIKEYGRNDIYVGNNLIIIEESSTVPLGTDEIKGIIKWLLS